MEVGEISLSPLFFVKIADGDVQAHGAVPKLRRVEFARFDFKAGIEADCPLHDIAFARWLRFGDAFHSPSFNPVLVGLPGGRFSPGLTLEQTAYADSAKPGFGQITHHLPARTIAGGRLIAFPLVGGVNQKLDFVSKPGPALWGEFVSLGIAVRQPARGVDAIENVVDDIEGEVKALAVMLDIAVEREISVVGGGRELRHPVLDAKKLCGVLPLTSL